MGCTWGEWTRLATCSSIPLSFALFDRFCFRNDGYIWRTNCWSVSFEGHMGITQTSRWSMGLGNGSLQDRVRRTVGKVPALYYLRRNTHAGTRWSNKYCRRKRVTRSLWNRKQWMEKIQFLAEIQTHCLGNRRKYIHAWRFRKWDTEHPNQHYHETWLDDSVLKGTAVSVETRTNNWSAE